MENLEEKIEREALGMAQQHVQRHPPYYGQIPVELGRDEKISGQAKALYGVMHSYSPEKELKNNVVVEIAKETLAKVMGVGEDRVRIWLNELREAGWIEKLRQGKMKPNMYVLYPMKKRTFQAIKAMKRVHLRINYDHELAKRLRESLYK
jgi:DNA-binding transcriptional ArsR family regulator